MTFAERTKKTVNKGK